MIIDLLVDFTGLDQMTFGALWEDVKFDIKIFRVIRKFAIIGDSEKQKFLAPISKPFVTKDAKFFLDSEREDARSWDH